MNHPRKMNKARSKVQQCYYAHFKCNSEQSGTHGGEITSLNPIVITMLVQQQGTVQVQLLVQLQLLTLRIL